MAFDPNLLRKLIPEGEPPFPWFTDEDRLYVQDLDQRRRELLKTGRAAVSDDPNPRTIAWLIAYSRVALVRFPLSLVRYLTIGIFPVPKSVPQSEFVQNGYSFGVRVVLSPRALFEEFSIVTLLSPEKTLIRCPFQSVPDRLVLHHGIPAIPNATTTCFATPRYSSSSWSAGVITAGHCTVNLTPGASYNGWTLVDHDQVIDASVLDIAPTAIPQTSLPLTTIQPIVGDKVTMNSRTGSKTGIVLSAPPILGYWGRLLPKRITTDFAGQPGDSGSLLVASSSAQSGYGLYMGMIPGGSGPEGVFQELAQVASYFDVDLFR